MIEMIVIILMMLIYIDNHVGVCVFASLKDGIKLVRLIRVAESFQTVEHQSHSKHDFDTHTLLGYDKMFVQCITFIIYG